MSDEHAIELPLFHVFQRLRQLDQRLNHESIDVTSYLALVDVLRRGYMFTSKEDLLFLCEKLWLKPCHRNNPMLNRDILKDELYAVLQQYDLLPPSGDEDESGPTVALHVPQADNEIKIPEKDNVIDRPQDIRKKSRTTPGPIWDGKVTDTGKYSLYISNIPKTQVQTGSSLSESQMHELVTSRQYITKGSYMPVNQRQIEQTVRSHRSRELQRTSFSIDVEATVKKSAKMGSLTEYVLKKEDTYTTDWKILIDHEGSMAPFQAFAQEFAQALVHQGTEEDIKGIRTSAVRIFYFKNTPVNYLYTDPGHTQSVSLAAFAARKSMNVLIISDAGAARGNFNEARIGETYKFLKKLKAHKVAWLNPVPRRRWDNSSAEIIAELASMFEVGEMNANCLGNIVKFFKSKIVR